MYIYPNITSILLQDLLPIKCNQLDTDLPSILDDNKKAILNSLITMF
jgi:hypothetical protein